MGQCLARSQQTETAAAIESSQKNGESKENTKSSGKAEPLMLNQFSSIRV